VLLSVGWTYLAVLKIRFGWLGTRNSMAREMGNGVRKASTNIYIGILLLKLILTFLWQPVISNFELIAKSRDDLFRNWRLINWNDLVILKTWKIPSLFATLWVAKAELLFGDRRIFKTKLVVRMLNLEDMVFLWWTWAIIVSVLLHQNLLGWHWTIRLRTFTDVTSLWLYIRLLSKRIKCFDFSYNI
jgi:hypothetical protein